MRISSLPEIPEKNKPQPDIQHNHDALYTLLIDAYPKLLTTSELQEVASAFHNSWQFPNCIRPLDGKSFLLVKPHNSGAEHFDYKSHHNVIMLALIDVSWKSLFIKVGAPGRASDVGVWDKWNLKI